MGRGFDGVVGLMGSWVNGCGFDGVVGCGSGSWV